MIGVFIIVDNISCKIDLYNDEVISVNSSIQNFKDIAKVFTDFSQTFKIPRSKANEHIFKHWYDYSVTNGFDHRSSYTAYIEVNNETFKKGVITIESASETDFGITFYGNSLNINERFGDYKLIDLDYSLISHGYNQSNVKAMIDGTETDLERKKVGYPLFAQTSNKYEYLTGTSYDITNSNSIDWDSLFPAVKITDIFRFIKTLTDIEFTGDFLASDFWDKLYLYFKNNETFEIYSAETQIPLTTISATSGNVSGITVNTGLEEVVLSTPQENYSRRQVLEVTPTDNALKYNIIVRKDGEIFTRFDGLIGFQEIELYSNYTGTGTFKFYFQTTGTNTLDFFTYIQNWFPLLGVISFYDVTSTATIATAGQYFQSVAPDMKLLDFITGLCKTFNLAIVPNSSTSFELIPLDQWYSNGNTYDLTTFVIDEIDITKPKLYKSINFIYEKSENIINNYFDKTFNRNYRYADLTYTDENTKASENYEVKLPFESPIFESYGIFTTATFVNKDLNPYTPKPVLLYDNGFLGTALTGSDRIKLNGGHLTNYKRFSNEVLIDGVWYSLTFGAEISSYNLSTNLNGLYNTYYKNYIERLYNLQTRVLNVKVRFTRNINVNDSIIIKGKAYRINNIVTNLLDLTQKFELI